MGFFKSMPCRGSDPVLPKIKCWRTRGAAESISPASQKGTEAGGSSTMQSSVGQRPCESPADQNRCIFADHYVLKGSQNAEMKSMQTSKSSCRCEQCERRNG